MKSFMRINAFIIMTLAFFIADGKEAPSQIPPDVLSAVPKGYKDIAVLDIQRLAANSLYGKSTREHPFLGRFDENLEFIRSNSGLIPERDIDYLLIAEGSMPPFSELLIATGRFDEKKIAAFSLEKSGQSPQKEGGFRLFPIERIVPTFSTRAMIPDIKLMTKDLIRDAQLNILYLSKQQIAIGSGAMLLNLIHAKNRKNGNALSKPQIEKIANGSSIHQMIWFIGNSGWFFDKLPVAIPYRSASVESVSGAFNLADVFDGHIAIKTATPAVAAQLTEYYQKISAVGGRMENPTAGLRFLGEGLKTSQNESVVDLSLRYTSDAAEKIWMWGNSRAADQNAPSTAIVLPQEASKPVFLFQPLPHYTEEARKAKISGVITLQVIFRKDGTPKVAKLIKGLGYGLDETAVETIERRWRFVPAIRNDQPIEINGSINVTFGLYPFPAAPGHERQDPRGASSN